MAVGHLARDVEQQAGLAGAADAHERDQPVAPEQPDDLRRLPLPSDERGQLGRQIAWRRPRPERREVRGQARHRELEDALRAVQVLEVMLAPVQQGRAGREIVGDERGARRRHEDLPAVTDRQQSRDPVEGRAEVVAVADLRITGMDRHPDVDRGGRGPRLVREGSLPGEGRPSRRAGPLERRQQAVAGCLDDPATGPLHRRPQQIVVRRERRLHRAPLRLPQPRAALDVGHEKRGGVGLDGRGHEPTYEAWRGSCQPGLPVTRWPGLRWFPPTGLGGGWDGRTSRHRRVQPLDEWPRPESDEDLP